MMAKANGFRNVRVITNVSPTASSNNTERKMMVVRLLYMEQSAQVVTRSFGAGTASCRNSIAQSSLCDPLVAYLILNDLTTIIAHQIDSKSVTGTQ